MYGLLISLMLGVPVPEKIDNTPLMTADKSGAGMCGQWCIEYMNIDKRGFSHLQGFTAWASEQEDGGSSAAIIDDQLDWYCKIKGMKRPKVVHSSDFLFVKTAAKNGIPVLIHDKGGPNTVWQMNVNAAVLVKSWDKNDVVTLIIPAFQGSNKHYITINAQELEQRFGDWAAIVVKGD